MRAYDGSVKKAADTGVRDSSETNGPEPGRFVAFLSYRRDGRDDVSAQKLQRALEGFRIPRGFMVAPGRRRLGRVFLDTSELTASADLGATLREALSRSDHLIVLCSPAASQSRWIEAEIREWIARRGSDDMSAVLLEGTPETSFPPALLAVGGSSDATTVAGREPLAVDLRPAHGKRTRQEFRRAVVRLAARLIGCEFDDLWRRDRRRRRKMAGAALLLLLLVCAALGHFLLQAELAGRETAREKAARGHREFLDARERGRKAGLDARPDQALLHLRQALAIEPQDPVTRFLIARAVADLPPEMKPPVEALPRRVDELRVFGGRVVASSESQLAIIDAESCSTASTLTVRSCMPEEEYAIRASRDPGPLAFTLVDLRSGERTERRSRDDYRVFMDVSRPGKSVLVASRAESSSHPVLEIRNVQDLAVRCTIDIQGATGILGGFSQSGDRIIVRTQTAKGVDFTLRDATTGAVLQSFDFGDEKPGWVTLSPDGTRAVVSGGSGGSTLVELPGGKVLARWRGSAHDWSARFSPDGRTFISPEHEAQSLHASNDGRTLIEVSEQRRDLWYAGKFVVDEIDRELRCRDPFEGAVAQVTRVSSRVICRDSSGRYGVVDAREGEHLVEILDVVTGERSGTLQFDAEPSALARDDLGRFWMGLETGAVVRFAPTPGPARRSREFPGHHSHVLAAFFVGAESSIATIDLAGTIRAFDARTGATLAKQEIESPDGSDGEQTRVCWARTPDGSRVAVSSASRVHIFDLFAEGEPAIRAVRPPIRVANSDRAVSAALGASGTSLITQGSFDDALTTFEGPKLMERTQVEDGRTAELLVLSPDGRHAVISSAYDGACVVARSPFRMLWSPTRAQVVAVAAIFLPGGAAAAIGAADGVVHLIDLPAGAHREVRASTGPVLSLAWSPPLQRLLAGTADGKVRSIRLDDGTMTTTIDTLDVPTRKAFHPVGGDRSDIPGEDLRLQYPHGVSALAVSYAAPWIAAGTHDGTILIFGTEDWSLLTVRAAGLHGGITALDWSRDATFLVASDSFESAWVFDLGLAPPSTRNAPR